MKKLLILICFLGTMRSAFPQSVQVTAQAPNVVEVGEQFQIDFAVNAEPSNFIAPEIHDFRLLYGPSTGQSTSMQIINGKSTVSNSYTYSYVYQATKPGKYLIGSAEATVGGKKYKSNSLTIEVVGSGSSKQQAQSSQSSGQSSSQTEPVSSDGNVFVRVLLDRKNVYQGEYLTATIKIYSKYSISAVGNVDLSDAGFFKQEVTIPQPHMERENVNGQIYGTAVLKKYILIPQRSGTITIPPVDLECNVQMPVQSRSRGIFDDFFGPSVQNVPMKLKSNAVSVSIKPLPGNAPSSFDGAVGRFTLDANVNKTSLKTNDAITLKVTINGSGNIKLINAPKITFPTDFDSYDPKITLNTSDANGGITGSKTFEYLLIPRNPGQFNISPITFSYFDVAANQYKTLTSKEFSFDVAKGADNQTGNIITSQSKEDVKFLGKDIRFIKIKDFKLLKANSYFFGSTFFYVIYILGFLVFVLIVWFRRRIIKQNANVAYVRNRRADKFASKRLKQAKSYLTTNEKEMFFDEVLKAVWLYLSDKLNISLAELSRDTALELLKNKNIDEEIIQMFNQLIDNCEFARYAPSAPGVSMQDDYQRAIDLITKLQQKLK
ncbi:MAG TPA: BatD family protein [Bacteroidales bacterium]